MMIKLVLLIAVAAFPTGDVKSLVGRTSSAEECIAEREALRVHMEKMKATGQITDYHLQCEPVELNVKPTVNH